MQGRHSAGDGALAPATQPGFAVPAAAVGSHERSRPRRLRWDPPHPPARRPSAPGPLPPRPTPAAGGGGKRELAALGFQGPWRRPRGGDARGRALGRYLNSTTLHKLGTLVLGYIQEPYLRTTFHMDLLILFRTQKVVDPHSMGSHIREYI